METQKNISVMGKIILPGYGLFVSLQTENMIFLDIQFAEIKVKWI
jgi:hypothetical protein